MIRITGIDAVVARMEAVKRRMADLTPVLMVAAQDTKTLIDDSFAGSHSPDGTPWAPLAASTIARRRGGSSTPLIDTARLRNGQTAVGSRNALTFGSNVPYSAPQMFGFSRSGTLKRRSYSPRREAGEGWTSTVPGRPFLPVTKIGGYQLMTGGAAGQHWRRVREMVQHYIVTGEVA